VGIARQSGAAETIKHVGDATIYGKHKRTFSELFHKLHIKKGMKMHTFGPRLQLHPQIRSACGDLLTDSAPLSSLSSERLCLTARSRGKFGWQFKDDDRFDFSRVFSFCWQRLTHSTNFFHRRFSRLSTTLQREKEAKSTDMASLPQVGICHFHGVSRPLRSEGLDPLFFGS
jgi:hypothetical protein